jgi:hypothetical protein
MEIIKMSNAENPAGAMALANADLKIKPEKAGIENLNDPSRYTRDPSRVYYMPISAVGNKVKAAIATDPERWDHLIHEYHLHDAWNFETEKREIFELKKFDNEIEGMIEGGLEAAFDCMNYEHATVIGTVLCTMKGMLASHRVLAKYVHGPERPEVRSIEEVQYELSGESPRAVRSLLLELDQALERKADAESSSREKLTDRKSVTSPHPWQGLSLPSGLPMDCLSGDPDEEGWDPSPFDVAMISLMDAADNDIELDDIFGLNSKAGNSREALRASVIYFLNTMNDPKANVVGLLVETFKRFLRSHSDLAKDVDFTALTKAAR